MGPGCWLGGGFNDCVTIGKGVSQKGWPGNNWAKHPKKKNNPKKKKKKKKKGHGAREMAQQWRERERALVALRENLGSSPALACSSFSRTPTPAPGDPVSPSDLQGHQACT